MSQKFHITFQKVCQLTHGIFLIRDSNFCPTRRYPAQSDPNGSGFTRPDKE